MSQKLVCQSTALARLAGFQQGCLVQARPPEEYSFLQDFLLPLRLGDGAVVTKFTHNHQPGVYDLVDGFLDALDLVVCQIAFQKLRLLHKHAQKLQSKLAVLRFICVQRIREDRLQHDTQLDALDAAQVRLVQKCRDCGPHDGDHSMDLLPRTPRWTHLSPHHHSRAVSGRVSDVVWGD
eukprot:2675281-Rhodomonas_salina.1